MSVEKIARDWSLGLLTDKEVTDQTGVTCMRRMLEIAQRSPARIVSNRAA